MEASVQRGAFLVDRVRVGGSDRLESNGLLDQVSRNLCEHFGDARLEKAIVAVGVKRADRRVLHEIVSASRDFRVPREGFVSEIARRDVGQRVVAIAHDGLDARR